jgi:hypothetical protein
VPWAFIIDGAGKGCAYSNPLERWMDSTSASICWSVARPRRGAGCMAHPHPPRQLLSVCRGGARYAKPLRSCALV